MRTLCASIVLLTITTSGALALCMPNQDPATCAFGNGLPNNFYTPPAQVPRQQICHMQCYQVGNQTQCQQICN